MTTLRPVAVTFFVFGAFWGGWTVAAADIEHTLHFSHAAFGAVLSAALGTATVLTFVGGALAERYGTSSVLSLSLLGWGTCLVAGTFVHDRVAFSVVLVSVVTLGGLVDVTMNVAATAALGETPGELVRFHAFFNIGAGVGAAASGVLLALHANWRWAWLVIAAAAASVALRSRRGERPAPPGAPAEAGRPLLSLLRREHLVVLAVGFAAAAMVEGGMDLWGVLFLRVQLRSGLALGVGAAVIGYSIAAGARLVLGPAAGRRGAVRGIAMGAGLAAVGMALTATAHVAALASMGYVIAAAGISMCWPLFVATASVGRARPAAIVGAISSFGYLGIVVGPAVIGWLSAAAGLRAGLLFVSVMAVCAAGAALRSGRSVAALA